MNGHQRKRKAGQRFGWNSAWAVLASVILVVSVCACGGSHSVSREHKGGTRAIRSTTQATLQHRPRAIPVRPQAKLQVVAEHRLPGQTSRFDYQSLDERRHLLFIANLGANQIDVIYTRGPRLVRTIGGIASPHGILVVPQLGRVFVSATGSRQLATIDEASGRVLARTPAGSYPDGIAYDSIEHRLFVSDELAGAEVVINARTARPVATIKLGTEAGNVQYDPRSRRMLVAIDDNGDNQLVLIDPRALHVVRRIRLTGCESAHGLHLDVPRRLAFVACADNSRLRVVDLRALRVVGPSYPVGQDPDVLDFDPSLRRLYVAAESGVVSSFIESGRRLHSVGAYRATAAHAVSVDPATHRVYVPLASVSGPSMLRVLKPTQRRH